MIIVDKALEKRLEEGDPITVGLVGAGFMGRGIALQILGAFPSIRLAGISNRNIAGAQRAYTEGGIDNIRTIGSPRQLRAALELNQYAITDDPLHLIECDRIEAIIDATGDVEFGAYVAAKSIENGKHIILLNAEVDALLGPILKVGADRAGVIYTNVDGDQPGVIMNLYRSIKTLGFKPLMGGNIKGMLDPYRTPDTQKGFAEKNKQKPKMVTSFADGTKVSMEMAVVANATGFKVGRRGMYGPDCSHVSEAVDLFPLDRLMNGGLVDYLLGAEPGPGEFVLGYHENPIQRGYLDYIKMGKGPVYLFYCPYHLCHFEVPLTVARAVLFEDAAIAPMGQPVVEVITLAKRDLKAGETLDGLGGFTCYGAADNSALCRAENLLPMGLSDGCRLKRDVSRDAAIGIADVELPKGRLSDKLFVEQTEYFSAPA